MLFGRPTPSAIAVSPPVPAATVSSTENARSTDCTTAACLLTLVLAGFTFVALPGIVDALTSEALRMMQGVGR